MKKVLCFSGSEVDTLCGQPLDCPLPYSLVGE